MRESAADREHRKQSLKNLSDWRDAGDVILAAAAQERYRERQRALAWRLERFRVAHLLRTERNGPWDRQVQGFILWRLRETPDTMGSTALSWLWMLAGIVPGGLSRGCTSATVRAIGATWLLRARRDLNRSGTAECLEVARTHSCPRVSLAAFLIARVGARFDDATRMAAGFVDECELVDDILILYPTTEKSDMLGARVVEPMVLPFRKSERQRAEWMTRTIRGEELPARLANAMATRARAALRASGVDDVRGPRRAVAEKIAAKRGRPAAAKVLRHEKSSAATARYTTTEDEVDRLREIIPL